jgi:hypothetical protein
LFALSKVTHRPTGYAFTFTATHNRYGQVRLGGAWTPPWVNGAMKEHAETLDGQLNLFARWLAVVKEEHEAPDLWAAYADESRLIAGEVVEEPERTFTPTERELLRLRLNDLRDYLIEHADPTPQQVQTINVTFNYMAEASERLTKRDWKVLFVGALLTQLLALGVTPDVLHGTMSLAAKYVLPILGRLLLP